MQHRFGTSLGPKRPTRIPFAAILPWIVACAMACESAADGEGPEEVVREFLQRMEQVHGSPQDARAAYELMWSEARRNLGERAKRASAAAGRQVAPEEMIAPSRFSLAFLPREYSSVVQGEWAEVTISAEQPARRSETVRCKLEDGRWRVAVRLPPLSPIQVRDGAAQELPP